MQQIIQRQNKICPFVIAVSDQWIVDNYSNLMINNRKNSKQISSIMIWLHFPIQLSAVHMFVKSMQAISDTILISLLKNVSKSEFYFRNITFPKKVS
jgi:hypothetical protein